MRSTVAEDARIAVREREASMSAEGRVRLALALGARDLRTLASARGVSLSEAYRLYRQASRVGRAPSEVMASLER